MGEGKILPSKLSLVGVDGSPLEVLGCTLSQIEIEKLPVEHKFLVVRNIPYDVILGMDFLDNNKVMIDNERRRLSIRGTHVPFYRGEYMTAREYASGKGDVRLACNVTIKPKQRTLTFARIDGVDVSPAESIVETANDVHRYQNGVGVSPAESIVEAANDTLQHQNGVGVSPAESIVENANDIHRQQNGVGVSPTEMIVENANDIHQQQNPSYYIEPMVIDKKCNRNRIPIVLVNNTDRPCKLVANTKVGQVETIEVRKPRSIELNTIGTAYENLHERDILSEFNLEEIEEPLRRRKVTKLLEDYKDVYSTGEQDLGRTSLVTHTIDTQGAHPSYQRPYGVPYADRKELERQIESMIKNDVIEEANSPWSAPVILVEKKDGTKRLVVDFRKLNQVTKKDRYPLPNIADTLDALGKARFFTTLDLAAGYWQVNMNPEDREKTAFTTPRGQFHFKVLPFGLCNAPSTFQRLMDRVLRGLQNKICLVYLDDIIIYSGTFEEHLIHLREVFERLRETNLKLKPKKCFICRRRVRYLGHIITKFGIEPDPDNVSKIMEFKEPHDLEGMRSFLGLTGYYRKFIRSYSDITQPLSKLTRKGCHFEWGPQQSEAFSNMKTTFS